jgi:hypothetical protein
MLQKVVWTYYQTFQIRNLTAVNKLMVLVITVQVNHHPECSDCMLQFAQLHNIRVCILTD